MTAGELVTAEHLGGYVSGGDPDAIYPYLWPWLLGVAAPVSTSGEQMRPSVLDVGCGDGAAVRAFTEFGANTLGVDGVPQDDPFIVTHDYTTGPSPIEGTFDLVWSCEFVEHVEEEFVENFLPDLTRGRFLAMTHALPDQPGWHHVNCKPSTYWISLIERAGLTLDPGLTRLARMKARRGYFASTGLVFRKVVRP